MKGTQPRQQWLIDLGWVICLLLIALIFRFIYGNAREILIDHDSAAYIMDATRMFSGGSFFGPFRGPGYPLLIGFWSGIVGDYILGAKLASIFSGSFLVVVAYLLGKKLYGRSVGITAGLLIAINVSLIEVATWELTEATYTLVIFSAAAVTVWAARRQHLAIWALAGFLFGFSYWVRPEGFFYLGLIPILAFIEHFILTRKLFSRQLVFRIGVFLLAGFLMAAPYIIQIHRETGAWTISGRTVWAALVFSKKLDRASLDGKLDYEKSLFELTPDKQSIMLEGGFNRASAFASYSSNLKFKIKEMVKNWLKTYELLPSVFTHVLILFMGIGLFSLKWTSQDRQSEFYLLGALIPWVIVYPLYEIDFENLTPIVPTLSLWASLGVISIARRPSSKRESSGLLGFKKSAAAVCLILLFVAFLGLPDYIRPLRDKDFYKNKEDDLVYRKVGEWIKVNLPEATTLMGRKGFIPVYADRKWVNLPFADYKDVLTYARLRGVDVIFMDEKYKPIRPQLAFLFDKNPGQLDGLIPMFTTQNDKGQKIILYKVLSEKQQRVY